MSDLGEELLKFVFNGLKKHLHDLYMRFDCIPPEFSPFRNFKKILENSTLSRYVKKKKSRPTDPIFKFWSGEGNITIFFFGLMKGQWTFHYVFIDHVMLHGHCWLSSDVVHDVQHQLVFFISKVT